MPALSLLDCARLLAPPVALIGANAVFRKHRAGLAHRLYPLRRLHNLSMSLYSLKVFVSLTMAMYQTHSSWRSLVCDTPSTTTAIPGWEFSKYVELIDVALVYAAGKSPSPLLLWHHATAAMAVAVNTVGRDVPTPMYYIGSWLNSGVMYAFFAAPRILRPLKIWITLSQIAQHAIVVGLLISAPVIENCVDVPHGAYLASLILYASYLCLFVDLFERLYGPKEPKQA